MAHERNSSEDLGQSSANKLEKHDYVVMEGRPCKVVEVTDTSDQFLCDRPPEQARRTLVTAVDLYTDKKLEGVYDQPDKVDVPQVTKIDRDWRLLVHEEKPASVEDKTQEATDGKTTVTVMSTNSEMDVIRGRKRSVD